MTLNDLYTKEMRGNITAAAYQVVDLLQAKFGIEWTVRFPYDKWYASDVNMIYFDEHLVNSSPEIQHYIPSINFLLFCSEIILVSLRSEIFD